MLPLRCAADDHRRAGALTARQRALHAPASDAPSPDAAVARVSKRKARALRSASSRGSLLTRDARARQLRDDGPDAALRREAAKARVRQQKEEQLKQAREAATAKILSGDTSRKRQAAKAQQVQEVRLPRRLLRCGRVERLTPDAASACAACRTAWRSGERTGIRSRALCVSSAGLRAAWSSSLLAKGRTGSPPTWPLRDAKYDCLSGKPRAVPAAAHTD